MIARGDRWASSAFRATLRGLAPASARRRELWSAEVLRVDDLTDAIARAERGTRARVAQRAATKASSRTAPILILDENAFYYPAGRIPGFPVARDVERRSQSRFRHYRQLLSWIAFVLLAPVTLGGVFAGSHAIGRAHAVGMQAAMLSAQAP